MLCQFSFQNFKSYKNETVFDFQAVPTIQEFSESLISSDKGEDLLPVGVIYGPNGGGKTNLLQAFTCLVSAVARPTCELRKNRQRIILQQRVTAEPFRFDETSAAEPTAFQVFFRQKGYEYRYYLALKDDEVVAETLDRRVLGGKRPAHIFYRSGKDIRPGPLLKKENVNTNVNAKMPYLSFLAINYEIPVIAEAQTWFESCIVRNYANPTMEHTIRISEKEEFKRQILRFLNDMGIDISDYRFDEEEKQLYILRRINGQTYELPFDHESDGTRKLIAALPVIYVALQEGRLVVIDELDTKLHPKLLRYVIALFKNRLINRRGAQLLFTSHDMATMKNTVFRRDEIWFAALGPEHDSEIYSLYDIRRENGERVNSTAAFDKQYLEGRYGADPYSGRCWIGGMESEPPAAEKERSWKVVDAAPAGPDDKDPARVPPDRLGGDGDRADVL